MEADKPATADASTSTSTDDSTHSSDVQSEKGKDPDNSRIAAASSSSGSTILCPQSGDVIWTSVKLPNGEDSRYLTDFTELRHIASGGFAVVTECWNKLDKKVYAVKKISLKASRMPFEKISREVEAIAHMSHPNIVQYYQSWIEPIVSGFTHFWNQDERQSPCLYIVMEHCPRDLDSFLNDSGGQYDENCALRMFNQIVQAVAHIHGKNIIHRDLYPSNIFLDGNQNVKVGDFGLAKELDSTGHASVSSEFGTYRAPEYESAETVDAKADIFSLGVMLAQLLYPPETGDEKNELLSKLRSGVFPENWSPGHTEVIRRLVSESPLARPTAAEILQDDYFVTRLPLLH